MTHKETHGTLVPSGVYTFKGYFTVVNGLKVSGNVISLSWAIEHCEMFITRDIMPSVIPRLKRLTPYELVRWSDE